MRLLHPRKVWFFFNIMGAILLLSAGVGLYEISLIESQRLTTSQLDTLVRSGRLSLEQGDYRSFVEGIGREFRDIRVSISSSQRKLIEIGPHTSRSTCSSQDFPLHPRLGIPGDTLKISLCRTYNSPLLPMGILTLLYFLVSAISLRYLILLESRSERSLVQFLENAGVEVSYGAGLENALKKIIGIQEELNETKKRQIELARAEAMGSLAAQVAHDIRSPLAALTTADKDFAAVPEETRVMVRSAIGRIQDIANHLLESNRARTGKSDAFKGASAMRAEPPMPHLLSSLVESILTEKRMQFRSQIGIEIVGEMDPHSYGLFALIQPSEFKRLLSNLVNNSVEALGNKGKVAISLGSNDHNWIQVRVADTGKGIPPELLPKLGNRGETHGKSDGSGLGLYHARISVEKWGGKLEIQSALGTGTAIALTLPKASWFMKELRPKPNSRVVILDDDESVHHIWQGRADSVRLNDHGIRLVHLATPEELRAWTAKASKLGTAAQYLLDYEIIGSKDTGLDLMEELGIAAQSILVTSHYEEPSILERCLKLAVPLVPKGMAGIVPIRVSDEKSSSVDQANTAGPPLQFDAALIDDDNLVHLTWNSSARRAGLRLAGFKSAKSFFEAATTLNRLMPVYVDSNLGKDERGNEVDGEEISRAISALGFQRVYLATGLAPTDSQRLTWLAGIRGKEPPFSELTFYEGQGGKISIQGYAQIRNYLHDLIKPIQQTVALLRLIEQPAETSEVFLVMGQVSQELAALLASRGTRRSEMSALELAKIGPLEVQIMQTLDKVRTVLELSQDEIAGLKATGELTEYLRTIHANSIELAKTSRNLFLSE